MFSVCSDYCDQVYWEAFRFHIVKTAGAATTYAYQRIVEGNPMFVGVYDKEKTKDVEKTVHEMFTAMQPGDVITTMSTAGHSMIYVGNVLGDGKTYVAHCYGASINATTGADIREVPAEKETSDLRFRNRGGAVLGVHGGWWICPCRARAGGGLPYRGWCEPCADGQAGGGGAAGLCGADDGSAASRGGERGGGQEGGAAASRE